MKHWLAILLIMLCASGCSLRLKPNTDPFYEAVLSRNPKNQAALYAQGRVLMRQGRYAEAESYFQRLAGIAPQDAGAWLGWGRCLFENRRFKASQAAFRKALELKQGKEAYLGLASATLMRGDAEQARELAREIEQKYGMSPVLLKVKGDIEFAAGNFTQALQYYRESGQQDASQPGIAGRVRDLEEFLGSTR